MPTLQTWGRTHTATVDRVDRPTSLNEVVDAVRAAAREVRRLKVVGALHSWSPIALDDGQRALSLDGLTGIVDVDGDTVRVHAGTRIHQLNAALDALGLALPILGSIDHQAIGGALGTGTHGSSLRHTNLGGGLRGATWVDGRGEVHRAEGTDPRLDGLRCHLGALGVLTELLLPVVPAFDLVEHTTSMPVEQVAAELPAIASSAEYVKIWWLPPLPEAVVFRADRVPAARRPSALWKRIDRHLVNDTLFRGVLALGGRVPTIIPHVNRLVAKAYLGDRSGRSHEVFHLAMPPRHREMEYALPMDAAPEALGRMFDTVRREKLRVDFITELRFVKGDSGWMSPDHDGDRCHVGGYIGQSPDRPAYYRLFEEIMVEAGGRPHWGKEHFVGAEVVRERYPRFGDFRALAEEMDPDGCFRSPFLERLFGEG